MEAVFVHGSQERIDHTPGSAVANGEVIDLGNDLVGVCTSPEGIAADTLGSLAISGNFRFTKEAGGAVTFDSGELVGWDDTENEAVVSDVSADLTLGVAIAAAADGDDGVLVALNKHVPVTPAV